MRCLSCLVPESSARFGCYVHTNTNTHQLELINSCLIRSDSLVMELLREWLKDGWGRRSAREPSLSRGLVVVRRWLMGLCMWLLGFCWLMLGFCMWFLGFSRWLENIGWWLVVLPMWMVVLSRWSMMVGRLLVFGWTLAWSVSRQFFWNISRCIKHAQMCCKPGLPSLSLLSKYDLKLPSYGSEKYTSALT